MDAYCTVQHREQRIEEGPYQRPDICADRGKIFCSLADAEPVPEKEYAGEHEPVKQRVGCRGADNDGRIVNSVRRASAFPKSPIGTEALSTSTGD